MKSKEGEEGLRHLYQCVCVCGHMHRGDVKQWLVQVLITYTCSNCDMLFQMTAQDLVEQSGWIWRLVLSNLSLRVIRRE